MTSPEFHPWFQASTLVERDALLPASPADLDVDLARKRLERWRRESSLLEDPRLAFRLAQQGLDVERFQTLLGSSAPDEAEPPAWFRKLESIYRHGSEMDSISIPIPEEQGSDPDRVFMPIVKPLLVHAWAELGDRLPSTGPSELEPFAELWFAPLPRQLLWMVSRPLILELYIARLEGQLEGNTPENRFDDFMARRTTVEGSLAFWAQYPVLGRMLITRVEQWLTIGVELATRLATDFGEIEATFADGALGTLTELEPGMSDRHRDGRTVALLGFSSGTGIVYKPRSLALDVVFQSFLDWLNERGIEPRLRGLTALDRNHYGWVERVAPAPCTSRDEIERFYARQGAYVAILYAIEATDFHHENLIAVGEHPVLIDLETLFQPMILASDAPGEQRNPVASTVLRSGLLPRRMWGEAGADGIDLSGLGARQGQRTPMRRLTRIGTDEMGFEDGFTDLPVGDHLPSLNGEQVPLWTMSDTIVESFAATYRKLQALAPEILESWIDRFGDLEIRMIMRPTGIYARLVHTSFHPDYLQDALHRERLFDKLWLDAERFAYVPALIPAERRDLWRGDFPRFLTRSDSRDLFDGDGGRIIDALPETGIDSIRRRLQTLDEDDLERQLTFVQMSLAAERPVDPEPRDDDPRALRPLPYATSPLVRDELLSAAERIAQTLERLALRSDDWISWFHLKPGQDTPFLLAPVDYDLYNGTMGMALFFAEVGAATDRARYTDLARLILATTRRLVEAPTASRSIGPHSGLAGWLFGLTHLGVRWNEPALLDEAETVRDRIVEHIAQDEGLDVIAGAAGTIGVLLELHKHRPSPETLAVAVACGEHLLNRAETQETGIAWRLVAVAERPLTGFAHGAAGIAWALARLAKASGQRRFDAAARAAVAYERSLFSTRHDNWPDLRLDRRKDGDWSYFHAWCHGAPGIGLGRLDLLDLWPDDRDELESEVRAAIRSTREHGFGGSQCLCHGDFGNLELLTRAADHLEDAELERDTAELAARIVAGIDRDGYRCGSSSRADLPGLMTGLAGIGYGLLRLAAPESVPSVLMLETPSSQRHHAGHESRTSDHGAPAASPLSGPTSAHSSSLG
ncbi:MAG: type 2 lanthipeptide synthetase LanM family protein [Acidobacteriota bacterium]